MNNSGGYKRPNDSTMRSQGGEDGINLKELINKLKYLFNYYASFGDRMNTTNLKSNKFYKLVNDANILDERVTRKRIDLVFCAENKHKPNMQFNVFLEAITRVAVEKYAQVYGNEEPVESLRKLLKEHLLPLYDYLCDEKESNTQLPASVNLSIDTNAIMLIGNIAPTLYEIYHVYFPWELKTSDSEDVVENRSKRAMFKLLREFEVCPSLVNMSLANQLWVYCLNHDDRHLVNFMHEYMIVPPGYNNIGTVLTLNKFLIFVVKVAYVGYDQEVYKESSYTPIERLCLLLERMELSTGFHNLEKKTSRPHTAKTSLIPAKGCLRNIQENLDGLHSIDYNDGEGRPNVMFLQKHGSLQIEEPSLSANDTHRSYRVDVATPGRYRETSPRRGRNTSRSPTSGRSLHRSQSPTHPYYHPAIEQYKQRLQTIFQAYCSFGEPMNTTKLKSTKYHRMLRHCGLLRPRDQKEFKECGRRESYPLEQVDVDLMFVKLTVADTNPMRPYSALTKDKSPNLGYVNHLSHKRPRAADSKMDINQFLRSVEVLAEKVYPDEDLVSAITLLAENYFLALENQKSEERGIGDYHIKVLMTALADEKMVELLGVVHRSLINYFRFYADSKGFMNFEQYSRFCKDFGIFPDLLPKSKILRIFYTLAQIYASTIIPADSPRGGNKSMSTTMQSTIEHKAIDQTEDDLIDEHLFVESLALCAFSLTYNEPEPSHVEKVCLLMERMSQSSGPGNIQKKKGSTRAFAGDNADILTLVVQQYPEFFSAPVEEPKRTTFSQLMGSGGGDGLLI